MRLRIRGRERRPAAASAAGPRLRIAYVADPASPNSWYRAIGPLFELARRGHDIRQVVLRDGTFRVDLLDGCQILHIHRQHGETTRQLVKRAKRAGVAVVWDNDDDLSSVPKSDPAYRRHGGVRGARAIAAIKQVVAAADLVTTPSTRLVELFRSYGGRRVELVENYADDDLPLARRRRGSNGGETVTVGWVAGSEHRIDVRQLPIRAALEQLLRRHRHVRVVTIGVGLDIRDDRYRHISHVPFAQLGGETTAFDVGIAPIADIPFNHARSNVKLKEYAAAGVPWLASPVGPYVGMGEAQGGRLVADDEWLAALDQLVSDTRLRRSLAERAQAWGLEQTLTPNLGEWERRFQELAAQPQRSA